MGRHDEIDVLTAWPRPPAHPLNWPELPLALAWTTEGERVLAVPLAGIEATLRPVPDRPVRHPLVALRVRAGDVEADVAVEAGLLVALLDAAGFDQDPGVLPGPVAALVVEHLLAPWVAPLEAELGGSLHVTEGPPHDGDAALCLSVAISASEHVLRVSCAASTAERLVALIPRPARTSPRPAPDAIPFAATLRSPGFELPAGTLALLVPDDVVTLDQRWAGDRVGRLWIGAVAVADTAPLPEGGGHRVTGLRRDGDDPATSNRRLDMPAPTSTAPRPPTGIPEGRAHATLDALSVTLVVEFDRAEMSLGELRRLSPGAVLPFANEVTGPVSLSANGEPFALGELVRVGDRTGVRITALV